MDLPLTRKVVLDTNVFIDYLRDGRHVDLISGNVIWRRYLSSVVLMELRVGANTPARVRAVNRLRDAFPDTRVVSPSPELYDRAGELFVGLYGQARGDRLAPMNDLLIALTAWRMGAALVSSNVRDFERIAPHLPGFQWCKP